MSEPTGTQARRQAIALRLLEPEVDGTRYRLIGVGVSGISMQQDGAEPDLFAAAERPRRKPDQQCGAGRASICSRR